MASARSALAGFLAGSTAVAGYFLATRDKDGNQAKVKDVTRAENVSGGKDLAKKIKNVSLSGPDAPPGSDRLRERWVRALERANKLSLRQMEARNEESDRVLWDNNWDCRDPQALVKPLDPSEASEALLEERQDMVKKFTPKVTRRIILVRHGHYNYLHDDQDDKEHNLTAKGREQARITGARLQEYMSEGNQVPAKIRVINSTMVRARETTEEIMGQIDNNEIAETLSCDLIREGCPIFPSEPPASGWNPQPHQYFSEGARIEAGFRRYIHRADAASRAEEIDIIVCHGNVIRYFVCRALQLPPDAWLRFGVPHASLTSLHIRPSGRVGITMMGEAGHMPPSKISYT